MKPSTIALAALAAASLFIQAPDRTTEERISTLESRVAALEKHHQASAKATAKKTKPRKSSGGDKLSRSEWVVSSEYRKGPKGSTRSQIRAVIKKGTLTEFQLKLAAQDLAKKHVSGLFESDFTVQFFDSDEAYKGWNGDGLLRDSDWDYWLARVSVETSKLGFFQGKHVHIAQDPKTGKTRTDVLRKTGSRKKR